MGEHEVEGQLLTLAEGRRAYSVRVGKNSFVPQQLFGSWELKELLTPLV